MEFENWEKLPIYNKALQLERTVNHIVQSVENSDINFINKSSEDWIKSSLGHMRSNSMIIPAKIAGAAFSDTLYDIRMENACIIRRAAKELILDARGLEMNGYQDSEYLDILRKEIDEFRVLFAEWVKTFDPWNYIIDPWGLFNPPGINYDDPDPDQDVPGTNSFLDEDFDWDELDELDDDLNDADGDDD